MASASPLTAVAGPGGPIPLVDLHVDLSYQVNYQGESFERTTGQFAAASLQHSGVAGVVLPLYIPNDVSPTGPREIDFEASYNKMVALIAASPVYAPAGCVKTDRPVQTWFSFEGSAPLAGKPEAVKRWYDRGVRVFGLVHSHDNALASSSGIAPRIPKKQKGLTPQGREFVQAVMDVNGLVDISHSSDAVVADVLELAKTNHAPVVATHSNCRALRSHARNLTDEQLRAIGESGGMVGVNFHGDYLVAGRPPKLSDVVAHLKHAIAVAGIEHVAIGSDFEGGITPPKELETVKGLPLLADALRASGLTDAEITQVFSGNARRLLCRG